MPALTSLTYMGLKQALHVGCLIRKPIGKARANGLRPFILRFDQKSAGPSDSVPLCLVTKGKSTNEALKSV